jgi:hypothetical protein
MIVKGLRDWTISYSRDGFQLSVSETSLLGTLASRALYAMEMDWWGKYKNLPFCWINPWGWTWRVGREEHTLGDKWMDVGQWLCRLTDGLPRERELYSMPLTDDEVREHFPETWERFGFLTELNDDESDEEGVDDE